MTSDQGDQAAEQGGSSRPVWTLTEAAQRCAVSRSTIRRYRESGKFPNARKSYETGEWLVPLEDLLGAGLRPSGPRSPSTPTPVPEPATRPDQAMAAELAELRLSLAVERAHRQAAEQLAAERARSLDDLRLALRALEPGPTPAPTVHTEPAPPPQPEASVEPAERRGWRRLFG